MVEDEIKMTTEYSEYFDKKEIAIVVALNLFVILLIRLLRITLK